MLHDVKFQVRMPRKLRAKLVAESRRRMQTESAVVRDALLNHFNALDAARRAVLTK